jgi:threonine/homoserine/homoserine lactone efflux protein
MVPLSHVLAFAAVVSVVIAIPGPSVLANPKSIVFLVAVLPEFTSSAPGHLPVPAQLLILGALFPVIALVLDSAWAAIADTARRWLVRSPRRLAMIGGTGGLVMIGLGISVAVTGRTD